MRKLFVSILLLVVLTACSVPPVQTGDPSAPPSQPVVTITSIVILPAPSATPAPSSTPNRPSLTVTVVTATPTAQPSVTPTLQASATAAQSPAPDVGGMMPYQIQPGSPLYMTSFRQPTLGCQWTGVAGQVFGLDGNPVKNVIVFVSGDIHGSPVNASAITGQISDYGDGGYEVKLGDAPMATTGTITVQLFDLTIRPLSDPIPLSTSADCAKNLILLNFRDDNYKTIRNHAVRPADL